MSFRRRLVLVNSFVVLFVLVACATALILSTQSLVLGSIDRDLEKRVRPIVDPPPGAPPLGPEGNGPDGPPMGQEDGRGPRGFGGPRGRGPNDGFGRPIFFGADGKAMDSQGVVLDSTAVQEALRGRRTLHTIDRDGSPVRVLTVPIGQGRNQGGVAQVGYPMDALDKLRTTQTQIALVLLPIALVASAFAGWFLAERALRPVRAVSDAAATVDVTALGARLPVDGEDELAQLAKTFNAMLGRLEGSFEERSRLFHELELALEQQRRFVADASHELRTPLARLRLTTSGALTQDATEEELRDALAISDRAAESMSRLVDQLLALAKLDGGEEVDPDASADLVGVARDAMGYFDGTPGALIELEGTSSVRARGSHEDLVRAVRNLLENARRYTPQDGRIRVKVDGSPSIAVQDSGSGISAEHLPNLTKRFYRADAARNRNSGGAGLGLSITRAIVERVGGRLDIRSQIGHGTVATLHLRSMD